MQLITFKTELGSLILSFGLQRDPRLLTFEQLTQKKTFAMALDSSSDLISGLEKYP